MRSHLSPPGLCTWWSAKGICTGASLESRRVELRPLKLFRGQMQRRRHCVGKGIGVKGKDGSFEEESLMSLRWVVTEG